MLKKRNALEWLQVAVEEAEHLPECAINEIENETKKLTDALVGSVRPCPT